MVYRGSQWSAERVTTIPMHSRNQALFGIGGFFWAECSLPRWCRNLDAASQPFLSTLLWSNYQMKIRSVVDNGKNKTARAGLPLAVLLFSLFVSSSSLATISNSWSPSTAYPGQTQTFSWSASAGYDGCYDPDNPSNPVTTGTSGSYSVTAGAPGAYTASMACFYVVYGSRGFQLMGVRVLLQPRAPWLRSHNRREANQNLNNGWCFWKPIGAVAESSLPPGAIPIEPFVNAPI